MLRHLSRPRGAKGNTGNPFRIPVFRKCVSGCRFQVPVSQSWFSRPCFQSGFRMACFQRRFRKGLFRERSRGADLVPASGEAGFVHAGSCRGWFSVVSRLEKCAWLDFF